MESVDSFKARAEELTGVRFEDLPDVPAEALLEGQILCHRDGAYVVTLGYPVSEDPATGVAVYGAFGVVDRARLSALVTIDLLRGSFGCADSTGHVAVDPYRREVASGARWEDCARHDGVSYSGVVETLQRIDGEGEQAFEERANARARELNTQQHCSRCS